MIKIKLEQIAKTCIENNKRYSYNINGRNYCGVSRDRNKGLLRIECPYRSNNSLLFYENNRIIEYYVCRVEERKE